MIIDDFCHFCADAINFFEIGQCRASDSARRAEMVQKCALAAGANAGNLIQRIAAQILQNRRICRQHEIIRPVPEETLATGIAIGALGNANQHNIVKAKLRKHIMGDV